MIEMDEATAKRYKAWKRKKILKRVVAPSVVLLVFLSGLILGLKSCGFDEEGEEVQEGGAKSENNLQTPFEDSTEEMDPIELDDPINDEEMENPIEYCGPLNQENVEILTDEQALSYLALVNNCYRVSSEFSPGDLSVVNVDSVNVPSSGFHQLREAAARGIEELFQVAATEGIFLQMTSGYRSFATQESTHNYWINEYGLEEALRLSAKPGHSEHQLGLAADVSTHSMGGQLTEEFASTPEGVWVHENAHRFGFIISYPHDREEDTGIAYEPWHIRYVGVEAATEIFNNNQILEEYLWYLEEN